MTQKAVVTRILSDSTAEVEVTRKTACGGNCESCGGACAAGANIRVAASNPLCAAVGDRVTVQSRSSHILGAAAMVYLIPLILFFAAYGIAASAGMSENVSMLLSFGGLAAGVALAVLANRLIKKHRPITFEITGIL